MSKGNKKSKKQQYSRKYFIKTFPPNHNPLIGMVHDDTLKNVHDVIVVLQDLAVSSEQDQIASSPYTAGGLFRLTECVLYALRFELYHRPKD